MYVLNRPAFRIVDIGSIQDFVECWERYYRNVIRLPNSNEAIDYLHELNLGRDLSEQNLIRLLRWKDRRLLTHPSTQGEANPRVQSVLDIADSINSFRKSRITSVDFAKVTSEIFPTGMIWQLFLFHIARPADWPIADQHVFRSYSALFNEPAPSTTEEFTAYVDKFSMLASDLRQNLQIDDGGLATVVRTNKRLDNALMAFGQFLKRYDR